MKTAALLLGLLYLTGCCVAEECDCPGQATADDLAIRFNRDTLSVPATGFTALETRRLVLIRHPVDTASGARTDSVILTSHPVPAAGAADIVLRRDRPFSRSVIGLSGYRYVIRQLADPGVAPSFRYELHQVLIASRYVTASTCCTCYENARKELRVGSGPVLDLHTPPGSQPAVVELRKR